LDISISRKIFFNTTNQNQDLYMFYARSRQNEEWL
jgi:hypothetical protein